AHPVAGSGPAADHCQHDLRRPAAHHGRLGGHAGSGVRPDRRQHAAAPGDHARGIRGCGAVLCGSLGARRHGTEPGRGWRTGEKRMRQLHFNLFIHGCGHHRAAWRHPDSQVERLGDARFYEELTQLAEKGKLDAIFFADGQSTDNVADGPRWFLEPLTLMSALARATERIGLISTVSSTFYTPFVAARMLCSLDHVSQGRMGWNVVTSMFDAEARNHGYAAMPDHAWRYARAEEFVDTALKLFDSWTDDALGMNRQGDYARVDKVRQIHHQGEHFLVDGPLTLPRSPQGQPVLFQAGASEQGRDLAARKAEAIYAVAYDLPSAQAYYRDMKRRVQATGRGVDVPVMPGLVTYVGSTMEEARCKQQELDELLPAETSL